jgi:hypothetical protein
MNVFLEKVNETIRFSMAKSAEKSYDYLRINHAMKVFKFSSKEELLNFVNTIRYKLHEDD